MEKQFWQNKWDENQIGFHQDDVNLYLKRNWNNLFRDTHKGVLVPLCGKSKDLLFLENLGHKVLGIEIVEKAVVDFFKENHLHYNVTEFKDYKIYESNNIKIICGDILNIPDTEFFGYELLFDRACIVALPIEMRMKYADVILNKSSVKSGMIITMSFDDPELGPPFSIPPVDLSDLYHGKAKLAELERLHETDGDISVHIGKIEQRFEYALRVDFI